MSRLSEELRQRTERFGSRVIGSCIGLPKAREEVRILGKQSLRSGTSVASRAREASRARSYSKFRAKPDGLLQEADESQWGLEFLRDDCGIVSPESSALIVECRREHRKFHHHGQLGAPTHARLISVFHGFSFQIFPRPCL
jgi:four helix bundle protein